MSAGTRVGKSYVSYYLMPVVRVDRAAPGRRDLAARPCPETDRGQGVPQTGHRRSTTGSVRRAGHVTSRGSGAVGPEARPSEGVVRKTQPPLRKSAVAASSAGARIVVRDEGCRRASSRRARRRAADANEEIRCADGPGAIRPTVVGAATNRKPPRPTSSRRPRRGVSRASLLPALWTPTFGPAMYRPRSRPASHPCGPAGLEHVYRRHPDRGTLPARCATLLRNATRRKRRGQIRPTPEERDQWPR